MEDENEWLRKYGGNWDAIITACVLLFYKKYKHDSNENPYVFEGVLWSNADYYYVMRDEFTSNLDLLSCVGALENFGFIPVGRVKDE